MVRTIEERAVAGSQGDVVRGYAQFLSTNMFDSELDVTRTASIAKFSTLRRTVRVKASMSR